MIHLKIGHNQALNLFKECLENDPDRPSLLWNIAITLKRMGQWTAAIPFIERYLAVPGPNLEEAQEMLAEARREAGLSAEDAPEGGAEEGESSLDEESARRLYEQGRELAEAGQYEEALELFHQCLQAYPNRSSVLWAIAVTLAALDRPEDAIPYFERYLDRPDADAAAGQAQLARAREQADLPAEEETAGEAGIVADTETARRLFQEGLEQFDQGEFSQALHLFQESLEYGPDRPNVLLNIAATLEEMGQSAAAIPYIERYLAQPGADLEFGQEFLARARREAGLSAEDNPEGGAEEGESSLDEESSRRLYQQARELYDEGQFEQALELLHQSLQAYPDRPSLLWNIAVTLEALDRWANAIPYFERYLAQPGADVAAGRAELARAREQAGLPAE